MKSTERWALTLIQRLALCNCKLGANLGDRARPFGMPEKQKSRKADGTFQGFCSAGDVVTVVLAK